MGRIRNVLILIALWPLVTLSQQPATSGFGEQVQKVLEIKGDPGRGETAFVPCQGCHRKDASGRTSGAYPRLAGQHATVLIKQISDFQTGRRGNPKMEPFIDDHVLSLVEIADIGIYLQGLDVSTPNGAGPGTGVTRGKQLYDKDCADCHGTMGEGNSEKFYPMVAAQHYRYLLRQALLIRDGDRRNSNPSMVKVIKQYSNADLEALADYMSQLPIPRKK